MIGKLIFFFRLSVWRRVGVEKQQASQQSAVNSIYRVVWVEHKTDKRSETDRLTQKGENRVGYSIWTAHLVSVISLNEHHRKNKRMGGERRFQIFHIS